jgi:hypothetical protein
MCPKHGKKKCPTISEQLKPAKSPEKIAVKFKVPVSKVNAQIKAGTKIEGEHTTNKSIARKIALQHVDERPDYYTKIKQLEKSKVTEGNLHKWFASSKSKDGKSGWVNVVTGGTCASDEPGEGTPKCVSSAKRTSMTKAERVSASKRKKAADPGQQAKSGAAKPTYVSTDKPEKMNEESDVKGKSSGKKDACYHKVKARYDVWPSAYASGALVKCRKAGAKNWGNKSEEFFPEDHKEIASGRMKDEEGYMARVEFDQIERSINILRRIVKKPNHQIPAWVQSKITRAADFIDTAAEYMSSDEEVSEACWKGYTAKGMKKKGGRLVPNCVKEVTEQMMPPIDPESHKKAQRQQKIYNKAKEGAGTERDWLKKTGPQLPLAKKKSETQVAHFEPEGEVIDEAPKVIYSVGQTYTIILNWKTQMINLKVFFPSQKMPTKQEVEAAVQKIYPGAIVYTYMPAIKDPTKPFLVASEETDVSCSMIGVNSFLEKRRKNYLLNIGVIGEAAAWTRSAGKSPKGGLNEKGRRSYERENPGSDLKAPSKKIGNPRRASFCARMKGMKAKLTSKKTARDPDSRINKSLRAWNC